MEAAVFENGTDDQEIGEDDHEADDHAQADDDVIPPPPVVADVLPAGLVEELDGAVVVASLRVVLQRIHVGLGILCAGGGDKEDDASRRDSEWGGGGPSAGPRESRGTRLRRLTGKAAPFNLWRVGKKNQRCIIFKFRHGIF